METTGCRNCGRQKVCRPRGLCWACYYTPGVRERFKSVSKFAPKSARGEADDTADMTDAELDALIARRRATMPDDTGDDEK